MKEPATSRRRLEGARALVATSALACLVCCVTTLIAWAGDSGPAPTTSSSDAAKPGGAASVDVLAPFIGGEWRIKGTWSNGNTLDARETFSWGPGRKFVICDTFPQLPEGGEVQRYHSVFGVQEGKLMCWSFVLDGKIEVSEFRIEGSKLSSSRALPTDKTTPGILHQSIELTGPNEFRWIVEIEKNGKRETWMDGKWVRQPGKTVDGQGAK